MLRTVCDFGRSIKCLDKRWVEFNSIRSRSLCLSTITKSNKFTISEIEIPTPYGVLAGKLWEGEKIDKTPKTPVICVHGWLDNCGSFDLLLPHLLVPNSTFFALDLPGHGRSAHMCPHYDWGAEILFTLHRVLRHFNWDQITLMGHSIGAVTSFGFVGACQDYVEKFIAIEGLYPTGPSDVPKAARYAVMKLLDSEAKLASGKEPLYTPEEIYAKFIKARKGTINEDGSRALLSRGTKEKDGKVTWTHDLRATVPTALGRYSYELSLQRAKLIKCPVCVIKGDPGEDYDPRENLLKMVETLKETSSHVEYHLVPGTHHLHMNTPEPVAKIINEFLQK